MPSFLWLSSIPLYVYVPSFLWLSSIPLYVYVKVKVAQ